MFTVVETYLPIKLVSDSDIDRPMFYNQDVHMGGYLLLLMNGVAKVATSISILLIKWSFINSFIGCTSPQNEYLE